MRNIFQNLLFLFPALLYIGCSSPSSYIRTKFIAGKEEGMITGTVSIREKSFLSTLQSHTLEFSRDSSVARLIKGDKATWTKARDMKGRGSIYISGYQSDFKDGKNHIFLFNIVKPEGSYKFFKLSLFYNSGAIQSTQDYWIDIPFEIIEGQTIYLGEIEINHKEGSFNFTNKIERDRIYFAEKFPTIKF